MNEKMNDFVTEHPTAATAIGGTIGLAIGIGIAIAGYAFCGKVAGRSAAKEIVKSGMFKA